MSVRDIIQAAAGVGGAPVSNAWDLDFASFQGINRSAVVADATPTDVKFNNDGTRMYVLGTTRDTVLQYNLSTPYQPSTALLPEKDVQSIENATGGVEFKPDGTKMYVIGTQGDNVNEFNLSTAWDVTTATFVQSKSVSAQTGADPLKVRFKDDGAKMYVLSLTNASVYQYSLSVAWDVSTASYDAVSFSVSSIESQPYGMFFGNSGSAMYITGFVQDTIFRFTLSTPWDLSTASYGTWIAPSGSTSGYEATPTDVKFNNDGTLMYVLGTGTDGVLQYNLDTAYQPSTAALSGKSVTAQETQPEGVDFKTDGTKMYVMGLGKVSEYDLTTAWDVTTASFIQSKNVSGNVKVRFKDDGTKMYTMSNSADRVYQYSLSTPWDISTASYDLISLLVQPQEATPEGFCFGDSGSKMYVVGTVGDSVRQYSLSTPWDLSTASYSGISKSVSAQDLAPVDVFFKSDGTIMYVLGAQGSDINQYALSTAWDVSTASYTKVSSPNYETGTTYGIFVKPDGTKFYIVGSANDTVRQLTMPTAWDVANMVPGFYVGSQEGTPNGLAFKDDGTKMYVVGSGNDTVYQYSLSTAWDTLTASYDSVSFSVATQELIPQGITFKTDGTKMYIIGSDGDDVNEYNLSSAWNISTASYVQNFSVSAQTGTTPVKVEFSSDGTKMIVLSNTNGNVFQYNLSSAWNISTASYSSTSFAAGSITGDTNITGLAFADSGTKMYTIGTTLDRVFAFPLSSGWTLSAITGNYKFVGTEDLEPRDVFFKTDGTIMYMLGGVGDDFNQYAVSTAWDLYSSSYTKVSSPSLNTWYGEGNAAGMFISSDGKNVYACGTSADTVFQQGALIAWDVATFAPGAFVGGQDLTPNGVAFKDDGTKMYVVGSTNDTVYQYSLATAWDVFTASYDSVSFSVASQEANPRGITFKTDGTKMYIIGSTGADVNEYDLGTAWNVSTASYVQNFSVSAQAGATPVKVEFKSDGTKMYVASATTDEIYEYALSSAWNISTASYSSVSYAIETITGETSLTGLAFADSGTKMYIVGQTIDRVLGFPLSTAWDLSTANSYYRYVAAEETFPTGVFFKPDGTEMYIVGTNGDDVNQYSVSTAWSVQAASFFGNKSVAAQAGASPRKVQLKDDGTKMYVLSVTNDAIYQYSLSTAWNVTTATYDGVSFGVGSQEATPDGMFIGDNGSRLYVIGGTSDTVFQYTLNTPWDLSTTSYTGISFSVASQEATPQDVFIGNNGVSMYVVGLTNDTVYEYVLATPWDVSTASYTNKSFSVLTYEESPNGLWFKDDGTRFYVVGIDTDIIWEFTIS